MNIELSGNTHWQNWNQLFQMEGSSKKFFTGEPVFSMGNDPDEIIVLLEGKFKLFSPKKLLCKDLRLDSLGYENKIWGLKEIYLQKQYDISAIAEVPCNCWVLEKERFLHSSNKDPQLKVKLMGLLAHNINRLGIGFE